MKKVLFAFLAVLAIAFSGCKSDNANVTVSVKDKANNPIASRAVFYTDKASLIAEAVLPPSPEELIGGGESSWSYVETNSQGVVEFKVLLSVADLKYYFIVYDDGSKSWAQKEVTLKRGGKHEVEFVLNK